ncbi:MAG: Stk1 family PASTA domain-containing Ser/Thr kinase [Actinobacteria bacterium]|nr:Stk1 family PASTA domain-containing Ser/Thr kinase [Actinomycetota bacterium]MCL5882397.1 Stk1 family PASTA domain-containing Ser/Thr kinase [Actinomycetota bacterium]
MAELLDNRYEIIRRLGSGGMADVYLARDTQLGREVAIKVLYKRYARDEEFVARFRREAQSAAGLNHPHIVSIYDRGEAEDSYYIAMEYLEGRSLKDVITEEGPLPPSQAIDYAEQILLALQFAHEHNVIHRDIKPHNIVISGRNQVKVTDFGIARAGTSPAMTETGSIIGTAQYLSPEQAKGKAVEHSSDLYSLGVVLYEMLTGRVPFEGENPVAIALMHLSDEPVPPQALVPEIPDNLNSVVMRALAKNPQDRYPSAENFLADLERCRNDLPVAAPAASADTAMTSVIAAGDIPGYGDDASRTMVRGASAGGQPPDKMSGRRKTLYALMALLAMIAVAAGIYMLAFAQGGASIDVPDVVGLDRAQAEDAIRAQGLTPQLDAEDFSDTVAPGKVISQNPPKGSKLNSGDTVHLVVSKGSSKVAVPDVRGQSASFADSKIKEAGLSPDRQPDVFSDTVAAGNVVSQDPDPATQVQKGSSVKYVVSKGAEPPKQTTVPDLSNLTVEQASTRLSQANLALGTTTEQFSDSVGSGKVISQSPVAGQSARQGTAVNIVISKGSQPAPPKVTVQNFVTMSSAAAQNAIAAQGLVASVSEVANPDPTTWGKVYDQDPAAGAKVDGGSTVTIFVGKSP